MINRERKKNAKKTLDIKVTCDLWLGGQQDNRVAIQHSPVHYKSGYIEYDRIKYQLKYIK